MIELFNTLEVGTQIMLSLIFLNMLCISIIVVPITITMEKELTEEQNHKDDEFFVNWMMERK